jgi:hypothetical protein
MSTTRGRLYSFIITRILVATTTINAEPVLSYLRKFINIDRVYLLIVIRPFDATNTNTDDPIIFWDEPQRYLLEKAKADVLVILDDQRQLSTTPKSLNDPERLYQLLARSSPDTSMSGAGESSFTTALCDSLEELLGESKDQSFHVTMLLERINARRNSHAAQLWPQDRGGFKRNIELGRLHPPLEEDTSISQKEEPFVRDENLKEWSDDDNGVVRRSYSGVTPSPVVLRNAK